MKSEKSKVESVSLGSVAAFDRTAAILHECNGMPYISLEDIDSTDGSLRIKEREQPKSTKFVFSEEHVLFGKLRPNLRKVARPKFSGICSTDIIPIRPSSKLDRSYLFHFLRTPAVTELATKLAVGINLPRLSPSQLSTFALPLPTFKAQRRIAEILDRAESLRRQRRAALALLDELTQSIFLDMFGDPVSNPMGWPVSPFGTLAQNKDSIRVPIKQSDRDVRSGKYPYYGSVGIIDDIDDYLFDGPHLLISEDGKHLESRNRPIACLADGRFWVNNHAHVLASNGKSELVYLAYNLEMRPLNQFVTGIDQFKLNRKTLDSIPVAVPPLSLQRRFAASVESAKKQISRLMEQLVAFDQLFASLQHRAFRGQL